MNLPETSLNLSTHQAVVAPEIEQHVAVAANPNSVVGVAPISAPSYIGGAAILVGMIGMLAVATQAAGLTEKQVTSKRRAHSLFAEGAD